MSTKTPDSKEKTKSETADLNAIASGLAQLDAQVAALLEAKAADKDSKDTSPSSKKLASNKK